jgi:hypothetical protein
LDDEVVVKSAMENPDLFVLKPQREGGGLFLTVIYAYSFSHFS